MPDLTSLSTGPAARNSSALSQIARNNALLMMYEFEDAKMAMETGFKSSQYQQDATYEMGHDLAEKEKLTGYTQIGGAVANGGVYLYGAKTSSGVDNEMKQTDTNLKNSESWAKAATKQMNEAGDNPIHVGDRPPAAGRPRDQSWVDEATGMGIHERRAFGTHPQSEPGGIGPANADGRGPRINKDNLEMKSLNYDEAKTVKDTANRRSRDLRKDYENLQSTKSARTSQYNQFGQMGQAIIQGSGQTAAAYKQEQVAEDQRRQVLSEHMTSCFKGIVDGSIQMTQMSAQRRDRANVESVNQLYDANRIAG